jgi:hypothetical protein
MRVLTLKGQYTYNASGWTLSPQTPLLSFSANQLLAGYFPFAMNGAMEFNPNTFRPPVPGSGLVALSDTLSANGIVVPRTPAGW